MRRIAVIFLMLSLTMLSGCRPYRQLKRQMIEFTSTELTLPEHLLKLENGAVEDCAWPDSSKVFVSYYCPEHCKSCAMAHLYDNENDIVGLCDSAGVVPVIVFACSDGDVSEIMGYPDLSKIPFPVYIDIDDVFALSSEIPSELMFHRFLIGDDRHPVFVGNPIMSKRLRELFLEACGEN